MYTTTLEQRPWNYCNVQRGDGMSCGDDVELLFEYDEPIARAQASLFIFCLRDESLADSDNLPPPKVIAQEIVDHLDAALERFRLIAEDVGANAEEKA